MKRCSSESCHTTQVLDTMAMSMRIWRRTDGRRVIWQFLALWKMEESYGSQQERVKVKAVKMVPETGQGKNTALLPLTPEKQME